MNTQTRDRQPDAAWQGQRWLFSEPGATLFCSNPHTLSLKVLSDSCRNLTISHFVCGFNSDDTLAPGLTFKAFL
jgi:hypothetical protein